ncbi:hypothetical protein JNK62_03235 [bacterium]|nr:hypothetical protein [bacterium]
MHRTLKWFATAFMLAAVVSTAAEAAGKVRKTEISYTHDDWNLQSMVSSPYAGSRKKAAFLPGPGTGKAGNLSVNGLGDLYQVIGMACQVGGLGLTVASLASAAVGNVPGTVVGGLCLAQQLLGLGMPPPPPTVVRLPDRHQVIVIPMPQQETPGPHEYFRPAPQGPPAEKSVPVPEGIPTAKAPGDGKSAEVPPIQKAPVAKTKQEAPKEAPKVRIPDGPQQDAEAAPSRVSQFGAPRLNSADVVTTLLSPLNRR